MSNNEHIIIIIHGSSSPSFKQIVTTFSNLLVEKMGKCFSFAYLKEQNPSLDEVFEYCYNNSFYNIKCMPLLLFPGTHSEKDIPLAIKKYKTKYPELRISLLPCLAEQPFFADYITKTIKQHEF